MSGEHHHHHAVKPRHPEAIEQPHLQCEICLKEVPASEAKSAEGSDYVFYFCGTDCYQQWRESDDT